MSRLREENQTPMSRLREENQTPMSRLREENQTPLKYALVYARVRQRPGQIRHTPRGYWLQ